MAAMMPTIACNYQGNIICNQWIIIPEGFDNNKELTT